jgi:hypothetical protein
MMAAGGDPNLFAVLADGIRLRAMNKQNLTAKQMSDPNKVFDTMGIAKDDNLRKIFKNNTAQNKYLASE